MFVVSIPEKSFLGQMSGMWPSTSANQTDQPTDWSINQPINQSTDQPTKQLPSSKEIIVIDGS